MKTVAIFLHYWPERTKYIEGIVGALKEGTVKPDEIVMVNNNPQEKFSDLGIDIINMPRNFGCRARHIISLLYPADYYLIQDDDLVIGKKTLENFVRHRNRGDCLGYLGKVFRTEDKIYQKAQHIDAKKIQEPVPVDMVIGRIHFYPYRAILRSLVTQMEAGITNDKNTDDILISMPNNPFVIPATREEYFTSLDEEGVGLSFEEHHFSDRDVACMAMKSYLKK